MATRFRPDVATPVTGNETALGICFREFLRAPNAVGSGFPASRWMIDRMLAPIDWSGAKLVVEYGPGSGVFTRALLAALPADARLLTIDTSAGFTAYLRESISDRRLKAVRGSAEDVAQILARHGLGEADYILSGLPFSTLPDGVGDAIMDASHAALRPGGGFLAYQMRRAVGALLEQRFARVRSDFEWRNLPPCHLYWADKAG